MSKKTWKRILSLSLILPFLLYAANVLAASSLYEVGAKSGIRYMSGGVGIGERAEMEETAGDYSLKVVLSTDKGAYISGVRLRVKEKGGRDAFGIVTNGPWLYVDLPEGWYTVSASFNGETKKQSVRVGSGKSRSRLAFSFDAK